MSHPLRTRFAPTPSGWLHLGNAISFVLTWLIAREANGRILLRIDDLDAARMRTEYVEDIFTTLQWLGLTWDEGPCGPDDFFRSWSQRHRLDRYRHAAKRMIEQGLLFPCCCTRSQIAQNSVDGLYPGTCRSRIQDGPTGSAAWRLTTPSPCIQSWTDLWQGALSIDLYTTLRDVVILRRDEQPAYQLASVVDDVDFGVTLLVRGLDLLPSTAVQYQMAGQLNFCTYSTIQTLHHPLILDHERNKLSKSAGSLSLRSLREGGADLKELFRWMAERLGLEHLDSIQDLATLYCIFKVEGGLTTLVQRAQGRSHEAGWPTK